MSALDAQPLEVLRDDIAQWRESGVRDRWLERVNRIAILPEKFADTIDDAARTEIMATARGLLDELGPRQSVGTRSLYAASNPIAEECVRDCRFIISEP